jgi:hypothetical protein
MTTSKDEETKDRIETMRQDADLRRQERERGSTYLDHHHSELGGRFGSIETETITGRPSPAPPPLPPSSPWSGQSPEPGIEPPLGYRIDEMVPLETPTVGSAVGTGPASEADAPSTVLPFSDGQRADDVGPSSSTGGGDDAA